MSVPDSAPGLSDSAEEFIEENYWRLALGFFALAYTLYTPYVYFRIYETTVLKGLFIFWMFGFCFVGVYLTFRGRRQQSF